MIYAIIVLIIAILLFLSWKSVVSNVEKQIKEGFPQEWEEILKKHVGIYHVLTPELRERFRERVHRFILTKPIVGYQTDVDDVLRILVASSAVMITLSFDQWNFSYLNGVILVDGPLNDDSQEGGFVLGEVQTSGSNSKMVLSKSALIQGFKNMADRKNVGVHEFAHVLDHADGEIDGIPKAVMPPELVDVWIELVGTKIRDIFERKSDIDTYGATSEAEFFAVATEYFFEKPDIMIQKHPQLYKILSKTFQQDSSSAFMVNFRELMGQVKEKIGRNAPCPCGSGKKFKRCCLRS